MPGNASTSKKGRSTGRVTLDDVAREASVSRITASRVLHGGRIVGAELVARVREAARKLGYVTDPAAQALASSRSTQVPVLVPMLSNALFVDLIEAVHRVLYPAGFQPMIGVTHYDPAEEELLLRNYLAHRPAGLLVTGFDRTEAARQLIASSGVPCVHLMETTDAPHVNCVGFSQLEAGAAMTEHLLSRGYKRIAYVAAQLDPRTLQRAEGYRHALRAVGLYDVRLELLSPDRSSMELGSQLLESLLGAHPDVDAIFFNNDDLAQGGLLAAQRLGLAVPGRVAIAGFNDLAGSDQMCPALSTIRTPRQEIGEEGARMLLRLIRGEQSMGACVSLDYQLMVRQST